MSIYELLVIFCWIAFILVWAVNALFAKTSLRGAFGWRGMVFRFGIAAVIVLLVHEGLIARTFSLPVPLISNSLFESLGALLTALGIAFAIWARFSLGRNWGMPMTLRAEPELVTSGPYRFVRHPIYTGVLLAMFGSALVIGPWWLVIFIGAAAYFLSSAYREERDMLKLFPNAYPAYRARTKMLIPFIF